jgi:hypothetical protein
MHSSGSLLLSDGTKARQLAATEECSGVDGGHGSPGSAACPVGVG